MSSQPSGSESLGQCVMTALSPPRFFAAWRVEAPFFRGFPVWWPFHLAIYLARCLTLHDQAPCCGERAQIQLSCLYDTVSCYFYTAQWFGQCQFRLTPTQHPDELVDMACCRISPVDSFTCWPVGPMSFEWQVIQDSHFKKKGGTEFSEKNSVPSRKTRRLHDLQLLPGYCRS